MALLPDLDPVATIFPMIQDGRKRAFLWAYATVAEGKLRRASRLAKVHTWQHYRWLAEDPAYAEAFKMADDMAGDYLVECTRIRATEYGPNGERPSDILLMFALKAKRPEYRDNWTIAHEHSGEVTMAIEERTRQANERLLKLRRAQQAQDVIDVTPTDTPGGHSGRAACGGPG